MIEASNERRYCTFALDDLLFGIHISGVQEVLRPLEITPVPRAARIVRGLINLRGQIVTAIDLRLRLGLHERAGAAQSMNVVVRSGEGEVSLLVDEVGDVIDAEDALAPPPETLPRAVRDALRGVHKLSDRLLLVLDADHVVERTRADA